MKTNFIIRFFACAFLVCAVISIKAQNYQLHGMKAESYQSLAGSWDFKLDETDQGIKEGWQNKQLTDKINLPGTTDEAGYGTKTSGSDFGILTRAYKYYGPAWYQKDVVIPAEWKEKRIVLELERVMWESRVFVDDNEVSVKDALGTSHIHDLGYITPGKHRITIRINNDLIHNIGDKGHVYTEYTQSIWNGVVGRIRLIALDKIYFSNPQVYTKTNPVSFTLTDTIVNENKSKVNATVCYELIDKATLTVVHNRTVAQQLSVGKNTLNYSADLPNDIKLWSDMNPNLYDLKLSVSVKNQQLDSRTIEFGFREVTASKSKMLINNKPVFLRGNLDCVHFPLTGYPSCNVEDWERIFRIYKDYGLNHVRFHSWCPPEAAFIAANRIGIYMQSEAVWIDWWMTNTPPDRKDMITKGSPEGLGKNPSGDAFIQKEMQRMAQSYGNNPSFVMMCIGNELGNSDFEIMESWLKPIKEKDSRRLYAVSTARKIMPLDQYMATHYIDKIGSTRGLRGGASTNWDFEEVYSKANIPIISHEIGQWPVYPKWGEIKKYSGVLKARNFEEFREEARKNKIEEQNNDFVAASGALNQIMYKYEIESFLRTPSCAGIQLLSMQDYQGQGEALIGWLDVFYNSKGITTPEEFRHHMDTTVTLLRMPKYVWKNSEQFTADIQLAHYGAKDLEDGLYWKIKDERNNLIASGEVAKRVYAIGTSDKNGSISYALSSIKKAQKLTIEVGLQNHDTYNQWNIWVYPQVTETVTPTVYITDRFDNECVKRLEKGEKVLLQASALGTESSSDKIHFYPLYWSLTFFPGQGRNTIGMLVQDKHPLFAQFPTDAHSDWQWESIYKGAKAFYINNYPENYKPIAQPVDDFHRNNKLASIFELKVGKGKLLVCGFDLNKEDAPAAAQLKSSILHYMNSVDFNPEHEESVESLNEMLVYMEPLKSQIPSEFKNAILYIECGANQTKLGETQVYSSALDKVEAHKQTTYTVSSKDTWKDDTGAAWYSDEITLTINCPQGIIGSLYVHFDDRNNKRNQGEIVFEGRNYELMRRNNNDEKWIKLHVMREDSNDGKIVLKAKATRESKLMISKVVLVEE